MHECTYKSRNKVNMKGDRGQCRECMVEVSKVRSTCIVLMLQKGNQQAINLLKKNKFQPLVSVKNSARAQAMLNRDHVLHTIQLICGETPSVKRY